MNLLHRLLSRYGFVRVTAAERRLLATARDLREAAQTEWEQSTAQTAANLLKSDAGRRIVAQMHALAHLELRKTAGALPGSEARALGYAHGYAAAAVMLETLPALIVRDSDDHSDDDDPAGAVAAAL